MSLRDWRSNGWLVEHRPSREEISDLLAVADRDLADCRIPGLSPDWRLNIAYNAALQASTAALAACGFRASRDQHHYRVIQSLPYTIGMDEDTVFLFDKFRKKRNIGGYLRAGVTSDLEADDMVTLAEDLRARVEDWLREKHPGLVEG